MLSTSNYIITHSKISDVMAQIGHKNTKPGICNGLAEMWKQALFCGEPEVFLARLHFICNEPNLINMIAAAKAKKGINLTNQDRACIDVLAFFDGVQLYQNFGLFTHLFKKRPGNLDAARISKLTLPMKLDKFAIVEMFSESRLFNFYSLQTYLNQLTREFALYYRNREALNAIGEQLPEVLLSLHSCGHKIALRYLHNQTHWEIADANLYPPQTKHCLASSIEILNALTEGLIAPINISIFTLSNNSLREPMQAALKKIKNSYRINTAAACSSSVKDTHLLTLTAMRGEKIRFTKTAKKITQSDNLNLAKYMLPAARAAIFHGQAEIITAIINRYADCLMLADIQEFMLTALITRQSKLIRQFIALGADINSSNDGQYPLHIAVLANDLEAVKELIILGAKINLTNKEGQTPLTLAVNYRHIEIINYLAELKGIDLEAIDYSGDTALITAAKMNSLASCEILLRNKADPNQQNNRGETASFAASNLRHLDCLKILIAHGAKLDIDDEMHSTPLFAAVLKEYWEIAALILISLRSLDSFNPFSYQVTINSLQHIINQIFIMAKSMPNEKRRLLWAEINEHCNALGMLLDKPNKKSRNNPCSFFKPKEKLRKAYLEQLRSATLPSPTADLEQKNSYVRL